jgi:hypothetical protein
MPVVLMNASREDRDELSPARVLGLLGLLPGAGIPVV